MMELMTVNCSAGPRRSPWRVSVSYGAGALEASLTEELSGTIQISGGLSFASVSEARVSFELKSKETALTVAAPRWGAWQAKAWTGRVLYEASIPSGTWTNQWEGSPGALTGLSISWDALPETRVTPRVWSELRWRSGRSTWNSVELGASGAREPANHRFAAQIFGLEAGLEKRWAATPWIPRASFELFRIRSTFEDLGQALRSRGWASGWRAGAGARGSWRGLTHAAAEFFWGTGRGWQVSLGRAF